MIKKFKVLEVILLFFTMLAFASCDNNEEKIPKHNAIDELSMEHINSIVDDRLNYLNSLTKKKYTKLIALSNSKYGRFQNEESKSDEGLYELESFIVNGNIVNEQLERQYKYFWQKISDLSIEHNMDLINNFINKYINDSKSSNSFTLKQKEILLIEFKTAKAFINKVYGDYKKGVNPLLSTALFSANGRKFSFWCGLALVGNSVATAGLATCIGTAGGGCAVAVVGKVIALVSIVGGCS